MYLGGKRRIFTRVPRWRRAGESDEGRGPIAADDMLVLRYERFAERAEAFFGLISSSAAFREVFLRDPAGTLSETILVGEGALSSVDINQANRLLFALLSNGGFMEWARTYGQGFDEGSGAGPAADLDDTERMKLRAVTLDRNQMFADLVRAIADNPDFETICSVMVRRRTDPAEAIVPRPNMNVATYEETFVAGYAVALFFVLVVAVAVAGETPGGPTQTLSRADLETVADVLTQRLPERAAEVRASGALTDIGRIRGD